MGNSTAAEAQMLWQQPPEPIASQLDAPLSPIIRISPDNQWMVQLNRPILTTLADLAEPVVRIAGITLNPQTRGPDKEYSLRSMAVQRVDDKPLGGVGLKPVTLPDNARIRNLTWSLDSRYLAFTLTQPQGLELWVLHLETRTARQLTDPILNGTYGRPCDWLPGDAGLVCKVVPSDQGHPPIPPLVPAGPRIEENRGREAPARTYTNLLNNHHDEALFEYYLTSRLEQISLDGDRTPITKPLLIDEATVSPDGTAILLETIQRPFSYQVPASRFPKQLDVVNLKGEVLQTIAQLPLADDIPTASGSVRDGRRSISWRSDRPSTLYWVEALDGGDARRQVPYRDALYQLDIGQEQLENSNQDGETRSPLTAKPELLWKTELRFSDVLWGHDQLAIAYEYWHNTRQLRTWKLDPSSPRIAPVLLDERNNNDAYHDPGYPITAPGPYGWYTLLLSHHRSENPETQHNTLLLDGRGASPDGVYPFLNSWTVETGETNRIWQAQAPYYERVIRVLDPQAQRFITYRQSLRDPGNFWLHGRNRSDEFGQDESGQEEQAGTLQPPSSIALTHFSDPLPWYADMHREVVRYKREDGLDLSATLYLPPHYQAGIDNPLPTLLWVYPEEYKSRETAGQRTQSDNVFRRPSGTSPLFFLTQGYAILMNPRMPIIGEGDEEPNDTYIDQLLTSAQAAVDYLTDTGISNPEQIAIGGHSYGAFTAANLLAHSDLFCAGIARSGAYNRTLTPFGFQGEQRNFWEAEKTYLTMSPFTHARDIHAPLLLIHGAEDRNSGTYPMQSERFYEALKGLGGTVRWVELPLEGHSYQSREAVGHVLWEMVNWLDPCEAPTP